MRTAFRVESSETCAANGAIVVASSHQFVVLVMEKWSQVNKLILVPKLPPCQRLFWWLVHSMYSGNFDILGPEILFPMGCVKLGN